MGLTRIECDQEFLWEPNKFYNNEVISEYDMDLKAILEFDGELKGICQKYKIKYIPMQEVLQKDDFIDGLHPNEKGHKKIFEELIEISGIFNDWI